MREDPRLREVNVSSSYYSFEVGTDRRWKDSATGKQKHDTDWVPVVAWNKRWVGESVRRGDVIYVAGRLQRRRTGIVDPANGKELFEYEVVAQEIQNVSRYRPSLPPIDGLPVVDDEWNGNR